MGSEGSAEGQAWNVHPGKEKKCARDEGKPARSGGDDVDDGRIIHSAAQKKGEERVLCVCVVRDRERTSEVGAHVAKKCDEP